VDNLKKGKGIFKWPTGKIYKGTFSEGSPHGIGTLKVEDQEQEVEFINGKINKEYKPKTR